VPRKPPKKKKRYEYGRVAPPLTEEEEVITMAARRLARAGWNAWAIYQAEFDRWVVKTNAPGHVAEETIQTCLAASRNRRRSNPG
jgi:hypothetical protein